MTKPGQIVFSTNPNSIHSKIVRFFTNSPYSHTFMITRSFGEIEAAQEAGMIISVVPFDKNYRQAKEERYVIYEIDPKFVSEEQISKSLSYCFNEYNGVQYGYLSLLWFVYRWANEKLLRRNVNHEKNWLANGVICSELVYYFLCNLGPIFEAMMAPFNPDTIQPEDIRQIILANPEIFKKREIKDNNLP
ncbi:hypothetical protein CCP1ISM_130014 [Azospirillaceae bacterium]